MIRFRFVLGFLVLAAIILAVLYFARAPLPEPAPEVIVVIPTETYDPPPTLFRTTPTFRVNLDEIAPPGRGRDLLINNCSNCHTFACALVGQRTVSHWETVSATHYEKMNYSLPEQDYNEIFNYLEENFNDRKPEPKLSPDFLGKGCTTPFR